MNQVIEVKTDKEKSKEKLWKALSSPPPPNYRAIEAEQKEALERKIKHLEGLAPNDTDFLAPGRRNGRHTNREHLEWTKQQLRDYRVIRPGEVDDAEEQAGKDDMAAILGRLNKAFE